MLAPVHPSHFEPVLTAEAMREADRCTIEDVGLPGFTLMESASRAAAAWIARRFGPMAGQAVTILCGRGNNGGDGLAVARILYGQGACVRAVTLGEPETMTAEAAHNYRLLQTLAERDPEHVALLRFEGLRSLAAQRAPDLYVDALLGTGLTSDLREPLLSLVDWLNRQPQPTVALDLPTGLHSSTGAVLGACVRAELTVTMAAYKAGMLLGKGPAHCGDVAVVDIGIPPHVLADVLAQPGCALRSTDAGIRAWLPRRASDAHKYSAGLTLVIAGAPGMTGAPTMASLAAARIGSGYVLCACAERLQPALAAKLTEIVTLALPEAAGPAGGLDPDGAFDVLRDRLAKASALLVGPGLGRAEPTQRLIHRLLAETDLPLVLDADGLNAFAGHTGLLAAHANGRVVLTPHAGEFQRLAGDTDLADRVRVAQEYAARWNSVLLLKGMPSVVAAPDGQAFINGKGGPALATAGTGDVLGGMCAGLLAQGMPPLQAAAAALHLGGACADRYAAHRSGRTLLATDLLTELPYVLHERFD